jgi:carboxymethylenebutenolidase
VAKAGFLALAPDGQTSVSGYPGDDEAGRELQATVDPARLMNDFLAAVDFMTTHEASTGRLATTGFCNHTTPRYDQAAADLAWQRTVAFFKANLA